MRNLEKQNILVDYGEISPDILGNLEKVYSIVLPRKYIDFIVKHNGATLNIDEFDYDDPNVRTKKNSNSIAFVKVEKIQNSIELLQYDYDPEWDSEPRFEDGLIPFGDNGGGDMICFDYRKDRTTDNPPIVIWNHEGPDHNPVFIANNFEEFINMLHEPED